MVTFRMISQGEAKVGRALLNEYLTELSEFDDSIVFDNRGVPQYKWYTPYYFIDRDRYPFFLLVDGKIKGICFVRKVENDRYEMAEFYLKKEVRGNGNALTLAKKIIDSFDGDFLISTRHKNVVGVKFWTKVAKLYRYSESDDAVWKNFIVYKD